MEYEDLSRAESLSNDVVLECLMRGDRDNVVMIITMMMDFSICSVGSKSMARLTSGLSVDKAIIMRISILQLVVHALHFLSCQGILVL
jgi:hypothetical protein